MSVDAYLENFETYESSGGNRLSKCLIDIHKKCVYIIR